MRKVNIAVLISLILAVSCKDKKRVTKKEESKPNVLFIAVDDLNNWINPTKGGFNAKTPNFDKLAARGVSFTNANCQAPLCGPSRASVMTGLRPSTTGIYGMIPDGQIRRSDNPATKDIIFLPEYFKNNGYHTMGIGKLFHNHAPDSVFDESGGRVKGFGPLPDERFVWDGYGKGIKGVHGKTSTDWGAFPENDTLMPDHQSTSWVIERLNKKHNRPFFMGIGFLRPHVPFYVPQKWFDLYPLEDVITPPYLPEDLNDIPPIGLKINDLPMMPSTAWAIESGEWKKIIQAYLACISFVDYELGRVLDALENSEYADNTIIVLWSDHGYRLGEKGTFAKHALWETATNAPLFFAGPKIPENKIIDIPVEMLSIYPTLLELSELPAYKSNEGISLVPLILNNTNEQTTHAITTFGMNNHTVRADGYRYIHYEDGSEEFYNHRTDPNEWDNEADNPKFNNKIKELKSLLPQVNSNWDAKSRYTFQPYFGEQKSRTNKSK